MGSRTFDNVDYRYACHVRHVLLYPITSVGDDCTALCTQYEDTQRVSPAVLLNGRAKESAQRTMLCPTSINEGASSLRG